MTTVTVNVLNDGFNLLLRRYHIWMEYNEIGRHLKISIVDSRRLRLVRPICIP